MSTAEDQVRPALPEEAVRLAELAEAQGVRMRLLGGIAIRLMLGERMPTSMMRTSDDLDYLTNRGSSRAVEALLAEAGWEGDREFNALNGARRLIFHHPPTGHKIDVFVEAFEMCHALPLVERIDVGSRTLPAAELALTKLQVVKLNPKDQGDLYALFAGLPVADHDDDAINGARIAQLAAKDWGLHHTLELNLARLRDDVDGCALAADEQARVREGLDRLTAAMEAAPKSRGWRMRAKIGERKRWYELPEEVER